MSRSNPPSRIFLVRFIGPVTEESGQRFFEQMDGAQMIKGRKKIQIIMNTAGGDVDTALAVYDFLKRSGLQIETIAEGLVASSGVIIFLAGQKRYITPHSSIVIHLPARVFQDDVLVKSECDHIARRLGWFEKMMIDLICEKTGQERKKVRADMQRGTYLDAKGAIDYGFAHKII